MDENRENRGPVASCCVKLHQVDFHSLFNFGEGYCYKSRTELNATVKNNGGKQEESSPQEQKDTDQVIIKLNKL